MSDLISQINSLVDLTNKMETKSIITLVAIAILIFFYKRFKNPFSKENRVYKKLERLNELSTKIANNPNTFFKKIIELKLLLSSGQLLYSNFKITIYNDYKTNLLFKALEVLKPHEIKILGASSILHFEKEKILLKKGQVSKYNSYLKKLRLLYAFFMILFLFIGGSIFVFFDKNYFMLIFGIFLTILGFIFEILAMNIGDKIIRKRNYKKILAKIKKSEYIFLK
ncbi:hypothetical protein LO80_01545 [Candidatus Francisella endociliophora]|uniref:Uncharacterized protein n=1 Tax=Candidatus Francisella endociliophora TaxID=653937 RepID=A0A097EMJ0_9GAMM|nr:hypothetical protein [Francisella sp. FSC1006]AIT08787.1 hypothetical protein LO80_01545 [Francisella sp. FSC1006]